MIVVLQYVVWFTGAVAMGLPMYLGWRLWKYRQNRIGAVYALDNLAESGNHLGTMIFATLSLFRSIWGRDLAMWNAADPVTAQLLRLWMFILPLCSSTLLYMVLRRMQVDEANALKAAAAATERAEKAEAQLAPVNEDSALQERTHE